jgi:hypothetical protein
METKQMSIEEITSKLKEYQRQLDYLIQSSNSLYATNPRCIWGVVGAINSSEQEIRWYSSEIKRLSDMNEIKRLEDMIK